MKHFVSLSSVALLALAACSDSDAQPVKPERHAGESPLYLAVARVFDDTTTTSYLHVLPSVDRDTEVDVSQARELVGAAKLFAYGKDRWFAVGGGEEPTITRYTLDADGRLQEGDAISLQSYGVASLWDSLYFVSDEKAYYPDTSQSQLIRWNPSTMEVTGTIPLPDTAREGYLSYYSASAIQRGDSLLFSVGWFDWKENDTILPETGLVELDIETDEVTKVDIDTRCGGVTQAVEVASGDAYFVSSALAAADHRLDRLGTEPCALRIEKGEKRFDEGYLQRLAELSGGALAGEPVPVGGDELFVRVLDESKAEIEEGALSFDLTGEAAWTWARWNVKTNDWSSVEGLPASTADTFWFRIDDKVYASQTKTDYSETTLVDLTADGAPERALTVPGFLQNIARVR